MLGKCYFHIFLQETQGQKLTAEKQQRAHLNLCHPSPVLAYSSNLLPKRPCSMQIQSIMSAQLNLTGS